MSFDDELEAWEQAYFRQEESEESESPDDDVRGDPSYTQRVEVAPTDRITRHTTRLEDIRLSTTYRRTGSISVEHTTISVEHQAKMSTGTKGGTVSPGGSGDW